MLESVQDFHRFLTLKQECDWLGCLFVIFRSIKSIACWVSVSNTIIHGLTLWILRHICVILRHYHSWLLYCLQIWRHTLWRILGSVVVGNLSSILGAKMLIYAITILRHHIWLLIVRVIACLWNHLCWCSVYLLKMRLNMDSFDVFVFCLPA